MYIVLSANLVGIHMFKLHITNTLTLIYYMLPIHTFVQIVKIMIVLLKWSTYNLKA